METKTENELRITVQTAAGLDVKYVGSIEEAAEFYAYVRDAGGWGASDLSAGKVYRDGKQIARISYNGTVTIF